MAVVTLAACGALFGAATAIPARRTLPSGARRIGIALVAALGALLFGRLVVAISDVPVAPSSGTALAITGLLLGGLVALLLGWLGALDDDAVSLPTAAALVLAAFAFAPLANVLTAGRSIAWFPQVGFYWATRGVLLLLVVYALARWAPGGVDRIVTAVGRRVMAAPRWAIVGGAALFALLASAVIAVICFSRQPQNPDEVAQLFHAKILLSGRLALPVDPNPEFFAVDDVIDWRGWYSQFPVGGPAFLALGLALHAAWLLDPLLLALTVVNVHALARRAYGEPVARAAAILFALSPFALFMSASYMNHLPVVWAVSLALAQLALWSTTDDRRTMDRSAALIGLALGIAFTVRPLDALVAAAIVAGVQLASVRRAGWIRSVSVEIVAGLIPCALLFWVNARTTGAPLRLGYEVLYGSAHQMGFHPDPYGIPHTPAGALKHASKYLLQLNVVLFEWPLPAFGVIVAGLLALRRPSRWDYALLALLAGQVVAYALYWHDGVFRGPRFLFTALPAVIVLAARAPFIIGQTTNGTMRRMAYLVIPACLLVTWCAVWSGASMAGRIRNYQHAPPIARIDPDSLARSAGLRHALVFIQEEWKARNLRRLWALGIGRGDAERLVASAPPCGLRLAIDAEEARQPAQSAGRLERLVHAATSFDAGAPLPAACAEDVRLEREGRATYLPFFAANEIDASGHLGGDVIYAVDLGERNERLRARFGDRTWYTFGQHRLEGDTRGTLSLFSRQ